MILFFARSRIFAGFIALLVGYFDEKIEMRDKHNMRVPRYACSLRASQRILTGFYQSLRSSNALRLKRR